MYAGISTNFRAPLVDEPLLLCTQIRTLDAAQSQSQVAHKDIVFLAPSRNNFHLRASMILTPDLWPQSTLLRRKIRTLHAAQSQIKVAIQDGVYFFSAKGLYDIDPWPPMTFTSSSTFSASTSSSGPFIHLSYCWWNWTATCHSLSKGSLVSRISSSMA